MKMMGVLFLPAEMETWVLQMKISYQVSLNIVIRCSFMWSREKFTIESFMIRQQSFFNSCHKADKCILLKLGENMKIENSLTEITKETFV